MHCFSNSIFNTTKHFFAERLRLLSLRAKQDDLDFAYFGVPLFFKLFWTIYSELTLKSFFQGNRKIIDWKKSIKRSQREIAGTAGKTVCVSKGNYKNIFEKIKR